MLEIESLLAELAGWTAAIRAYNPSAAGSNFEYSVPFTEMVCLGSMAILVGKKFNWDPVAMKTSLAEADALLYPNYRRGWAIDDLPVPSSVIA